MFFLCLVFSCRVKIIMGNTGVLALVCTRQHPNSIPAERKLTGHGECSNKQSNVPSTNHDGLTLIYTTFHPRVFVFPSSPYPNEQDEHVKDDNSQQSFQVNGHLPRARLGLWTAGDFKRLDADQKLVSGSPHLIMFQSKVKKTLQ